MTEPQANPLTEASPQSLEEFFSRNPEDLSDGDMKRMILEFRRQREAWLKAEAAGAKRAPTAVKGKTAKSAVTLSDLGLEE
jgi:hypothetical protein